MNWPEFWTEQEYARILEIRQQTGAELVRVCLAAQESAAAAGTPALVAAYGVLSALVETLSNQATAIARYQQTAPLPGDAELFDQFQRGITDAVMGILGRDFLRPEGKTGQA